MKYFILIVSLVIGLLACRNETNTHAFKADPIQLPSSIFTIRVDRDTTIVTPNGALLNIPAGALSVDDGSSAPIEIKEAYTMQQIITGGLTTISNGEPLSSGGMIYINAAGGKTVRITKPIRVAIPSSSLQRNMQLYKGVETTPGKIAWGDPQPLPRNSQLDAIDTGRSIFQSLCRNCHGIGVDGTGPDLANILKRKHIDDEYGFPTFHQMIRRAAIDTVVADTSSKHVDNAGIYQCNVRKMFGTTPPVFSALTSEDVFNIFKYIQTESNRRHLPMPAHSVLDDAIDSCSLYKDGMATVQQRIDELNAEKEDMIDQNGAMVNRENTAATLPTDTAIPPPAMIFDDRVSPRNYESQYYQFTIETFGWYNLDFLLKMNDGIRESELFVRIRGQYRSRINVYLLIPDFKVCVAGGPTERAQDEYAFVGRDGKAPLPQHVPAYVLAVTELDDEIAYALEKFTISTSNSMEIELKSSTTEKFNSSLAALELPDIKVTVNESLNATRIRNVVGQLDSLTKERDRLKSYKPVNVDCGCMLERVLPSTSK